MEEEIKKYLKEHLDVRVSRTYGDFCSHLKVEILIDNEEITSDSIDLRSLESSSGW